MAIDWSGEGIHISLDRKLRNCSFSVGAVKWWRSLRVSEKLTVFTRIMNALE